MIICDDLHSWLLPMHYVLIAALHHRTRKDSMSYHDIPGSCLEGDPQISASKSEGCLATNPPENKPVYVLHIECETFIVTCRRKHIWIYLQTHTHMYTHKHIHTHIHHTHIHSFLLTKHDSSRRKKPSLMDRREIAKRWQRQRTDSTRGLLRSESSDTHDPEG